ncbi:MAG: IclR family transcriptional regulator [Clostridia bacterium]|jgi:DNA-binding IclR family transcriptional regulator|nr:IclR family transcriptional regulator [Clostridia bacterium]
MDKQVQTINSLARGLAIIDLIHEHGRLGVTELGKLLGVNKSSAYRLLKTLEEHGYVEQIAENGKYTLGLKLCKFRERVLDSYDIRAVAHPYLEELTRLTGEAAGLSVRKGDEVFLIDCLSAPHHLGVILQIGDREELHCTAHGKAMLSALPEDEQRRLLKKEKLTAHTVYTVTDREQLLAVAKADKARRYAVDNEETTLGMRCVAANIYDFSGNVVAAIGISGPTDRVTEEKIPEYAGIITRIAETISRRLGY